MLFASSRGMTRAQILNGTGHSQALTLDRTKLTTWGAYRRMLVNLKQIGPDAAYAFGCSLPKRGTGLFEGLGAFVFSPISLAQLMTSQTQSGLSQHVQASFTRAGSTHYIAEFVVTDEKTVYPEFFEVIRGLYERMPTSLGQPPAEIVVSNIPNGKRFLCSVTRGSSMVGRVISALLHPFTLLLGGNAFAAQIVDIEDKNNELLFEIEQRDAEEMQRRMLERKLAEFEKARAVGQVAAGIAHDYNNLLVVIGMTLDLLQKRDGLTPDMSEDLSIIGEAAARGTELTTRLTQLQQTPQLDIVSLPVNTVLESFTRFARRVLRDGVTIEVVPGDGVGSLFADEAALHRVLLNLCSNANDAMPNGGVLTLAASRDLTDNSVVLRVGDTGSGIPLGLRDTLFEPYVTTNGQNTGRGLGLTSSLQLIHGMAGALTLEETSSAGTTFAIRLPGGAG